MFRSQTCWCLGIVAAVVVAAGTGFADENPMPSGDAVIRAAAGRSEIVITTTSRLAGAIHSLTWDGREFIDSADHGRQLQSASNFDCGERFIPEVFNPTEAGSMSDGDGPRSSSRLLHLKVGAKSLETRSRMAFWLKPGETSGGHPARNTTILSNHLLHKRVEIGSPDDPHVIHYDVTFTLPPGETHTLAQFEALTGYMPEEFSRFWGFDASRGELLALDDGPGEQPLPVVLGTRSGSHAMGIYAARSANSRFGRPGYGRFRFPAEHVTKWNVVFRVRDSVGVPAGDYPFRLNVLVGTQADVQAGLIRLARADSESP